MTLTQSKEHVLKVLTRRNLAVMSDFDFLECSFRITSAPITLPHRKLRALWELETHRIEPVAEPGVEERLQEILDNMTQ